MSGKPWIVTGILLAGLSVVIGAFGAHGLESRLSSLEPAEFNKKLDYWKTGALYQFFHALGILSIGLVAALDRSRQSWFHLAAVLMIAGIVLFSGLLYLMAVTDYRMGMVVPLGGLAFILGWTAFAVGAVRMQT